MGRKFRFTGVGMSNDNKTQSSISSQVKRTQMTPTGDGSPPDCYTAMWGPHPLRMHEVTPAGDGSLPICSIARRNSRPCGSSCLTTVLIASARGGPWRTWGGVFT